VRRLTFRAVEVRLAAFVVAEVLAALDHHAFAAGLASARFGALLTQDRLPRQLDAIAFH
jgi:hypothetical protein